MSVSCLPGDVWSVVVPTFLASKETCWCCRRRTLMMPSAGEARRMEPFTSRPEGVLEKKLLVSGNQVKSNIPEPADKHVDDLYTRMWRALCRHAESNRCIAMERKKRTRDASQRPVTTLHSTPCSFLWTTGTGRGQWGRAWLCKGFGFTMDRTEGRAGSKQPRLR